MGRFEEQMVVHMTGRWQPGAEVEHDTVRKHNTVLAGTVCPAFTPRWFIKRCRDQEGLLDLYWPCTSNSIKDSNIRLIFKKKNGRGCKIETPL